VAQQLIIRSTTIIPVMSGIVVAPPANRKSQIAIISHDMTSAADSRRFPPKN